MHTPSHHRQSAHTIRLFQKPALDYRPMKILRLRFFMLEIQAFSSNSSTLHVLATLLSLPSTFALGCPMFALTPPDRTHRANAWKTARWQHRAENRDERVVACGQPQLRSTASTLLGGSSFAASRRNGQADGSELMEAAYCPSRKSESRHSCDSLAGDDKGTPKPGGKMKRIETTGFPSQSPCRLRGVI